MAVLKAAMRVGEKVVRSDCLVNQMVAKKVARRAASMAETKVALRVAM